MMRRVTWAIALLAAAVPATAQMPPSIRKPIDAARRQANKTSEQINTEQKAGNDQGSKAAAMPATSAQAGPKPAAQKGAPVKQPAPAANAGTVADSSARAAAALQKRGAAPGGGTKGALTFYRETFSYEAEGRRDPFVSLMGSSELRPLISDLTLVGVIYDEAGSNSVAILADASAGGQTIRKKLGDALGRMKITKISENSIALHIDEFGFARQETLLIDRNPRTGARRPQ
jgi:hypothetical protein